VCVGVEMELGVCGRRNGTWCVWA